MYKEHGGCPSGGVVVKIGYIKGKQCIVVANDATVKAGAWFPITGKKEFKSSRNCHRKQIPIIYLVDSAGCICHFKMKFFQTKNILVVFLETMPL